MELGVQATRPPCARLGTLRGVSRRTPFCGTSSRVASTSRSTRAYRSIAQRPKRIATLRGNRLQCRALSSDRDVDSLFGDSLFQNLDRTFADVDRLQRDIESQMRRDMQQIQRAERDMEQIRQQTRQQMGARTLSQQGNTEERLGDGGYRRTYYSQSITVYGGGYQQPPPAQGNLFLPIFAPILALTIFAGGALRLWQGFHRTKYASRKKLQLVLFWPFLYLFSKSFRQEFRKAFNNQTRPTERPPVAEEATVDTNGSVDKK
mmetsp:Transcript_33825/g.73972  ORF Transcript_33825/g.73972 Transcript_33825/m.73972 type:complete len:262 (+) Transcript_33825:81-866(+)|eukprot:CAMPEP_0118934922 /NCGR_PEP_ID=MMETSP1169-20130426/14498_1 /TAXON_ID=36882 /ORGANISM="Pyramimonas obovata, Strain CCMP722" /LENGTH=261 /DNA_ID=CAMNT_0006877885 /DNA_START=68 /DNA_END=853 /DNA_ORIENTATION=-